MAALFDLHMLIALNNGWLRMTGATSTTDKGKTNFRNCFPMVETAVVDSWFTELTSATKPVRFRSFGSPGQDGFPLVIVKLESETPHTEVLGDVLTPFLEGTPVKARGRYLLGNVVAQEVDVYVATQSHELTRALYTCVRALIHRIVPTLLEAGYVDVRFLSAAEILPDEQLLSEDAGIFTRHMRWKALATIEAYPLEDGTAVVDSGTAWYVNIEDLTGGKVSAIE